MDFSETTEMLLQFVERCLRRIESLLLKLDATQKQVYEELVNRISAVMSDR